MRDWGEVARENLGRHGAACSEAVAEELGAFLEDSCRELEAAGVDPEDADTRTLERAGDWSRLARGLRRLEEVPMERARRMWIPGLVNAALAFGLLRLATVLGVEPSVRFHGYGEYAVYWPWLPIVALLAAAATHWAARHGADAPETALVGLFPAVAMLALLLALFAIGMLLEVDSQVPLAVKTSALAGLLTTWVVLPGAAALLGATPFLLGAGRARRHPA